MSLGIERENLLGLLCSEHPDITTAEKWQRVIHLAEAHGVGTLLFLKLKQSGLNNQVPAELLPALHSEYLLATARNLLIYHQMAGIFDEFAHTGISGIFLKGAYLVEHVYGDLGARSIGDVDLLARKRDLVRMGESLKRFGFSPSSQPENPIKELHHFVYQHTSNDLIIELHWDLIDQTYQIHADIDGIWQRARAIQVSGINVFEMVPEDQVLHLCIHASVDSFNNGLRALCDLAETLRHFQTTMDWNCLRQRAFQWKAERCVFVSLELARKLLSAPVPEDFLDSLKPPAFEPRFLAIATESLFTLVDHSEEKKPAWNNVVEFWAAGSLWRKVVIFWQRLFLPWQIMAMRYSIPASSWRVLMVYPLRLFDLVRQNGGLFWRLLLRDPSLLPRAEKQDQVNALRRWLLVG